MKVFLLDSNSKKHKWAKEIEETEVKKPGVLRRILQELPQHLLPATACPSKIRAISFLTPLPYSDKPEKSNADSGEMPSNPPLPCLIRRRQSFAPGRMRSWSWRGDPYLWLDMNYSHLSLCPMLWWVAELLSELFWPIFTMVPLYISHLVDVACIFSASSPVLADVRWKGRLAGRTGIWHLVPFPLC